MFSMPDVAVILGVALLIFGPGKLPDIGKSLGKGLKDFKKAIDESHESKEEKTVKEVALDSQDQSPEKTKQNT